MTSIPWDSLVSVAVGALLAFSSTMLTQGYAARRENTARSYEHRRAAYVDFITVFRKQWDRYCLAIMASERERITEPLEGFLDPMLACLVQVQLFGTKKAVELATEVYGDLSGEVLGGRSMRGDVLTALVAEIRRDLSIPDL